MHVKKTTPLRMSGVSLAVFVAALLVAACSSAPSGTNSQTNSQKKVTLVLANSQWLDTVRGVKLWAAMTAYEKVNPNVVVKQEAIPNADIATKLGTELGAGQGPDLMFIQDTVFDTFAAAGFLEPLDDAVKGVPLNNTSDGTVFGGKRLGVAWQRSDFGLLYNKQLLKEAGVSVPTTTDELIAAAKKVSEVTGAGGLGDPDTSADAGIWTETIDDWIYGYGGSWANNGKLTIDSAANIKGLTEFKKVYDSGVIPKGQTFTTFRAEFDQGKLAFMFDNSAGALVASLNGGIKPTDIGVAHIPMPDNGFHEQLFVAVNKNSANVQAALKFVTWLTSKPGQETLRSASGPDVLATDVAPTAAYAKANPWGAEFTTLGKTSRSLLIPGFETQTGQIMQIVITNVEGVLVSGVSPAQALQQAQAQANQAVK